MMKQRSNLSYMPVRRTRFQKQAHQVRHYAQQSPLLSHWFTALSLTFPAGEQFFVHSVRQVRHLIDDEELQARISAFIGQEAMHAQAHQAFNQSLDDTHYPIMHYAELTANGLEQLKNLSARRQLAATVAYEHFTALFAAQFLKKPRLFNGFDPNLQQLWLWHAVEEIEHKSVAFDVYQQLYANVAQRRRSMRTVSVAFVLGLTAMTAHLMWLDRKHSLFSLKAMGLNLRDALSLVGLFVQIAPEYLQFYRRDFHPNQHNHEALLTQWRQHLQLNQGLATL